MKNKTNDLLDEFLSDEEKEEKKIKQKSAFVDNTKVMKEGSGLVERINRVLVTSDGRQLLSE